MDVVKRGGGQVSFEYLMIIAISFILVAPLFVFYLNTVQDIKENADLNYMSLLQNKIIESAEQVYFQGFDSKKTLVVYIPKSIKKIEFQGNNIIFYVQSGPLEHEIVRTTYANVSGIINESGIIKEITFQYVGGVVEVR